jgi:hypothetical protein
MFDVHIIKSEHDPNLDGGIRLIKDNSPSTSLTKKHTYHQYPHLQEYSNQPEEPEDQDGERDRTIFSDRCCRQRGHASVRQQGGRGESCCLVEEMRLVGYSGGASFAL